MDGQFEVFRVEASVPPDPTLRNVAIQDSYWTRGLTATFLYLHNNLCTKECFLAGFNLIKCLRLFLHFHSVGKQLQCTCLIGVWSYKRWLLTTLKETRAAQLDKPQLSTQLSQCLGGTICPSRQVLKLAPPDVPTSMVLHLGNYWDI